MDIISQLLLLSFMFAIGYVVITFQVVALSRLYQSRAWGVLASGFILAGAMQIWRLIRFPLNMMQARIRGALPESLTAEQWINISLAFLVVALLIIGFDKLRRDLKRIGI